jgi:hypothetical protein
MCFDYEIPEKIELKYKKLVKKQEEDDTEKVKEKPIIINA